MHSGSQLALAERLSLRKWNLIFPNFIQRTLIAVNRFIIAEAEFYSKEHTKNVYIYIYIYIYINMHTMYRI